MCHPQLLSTIALSFLTLTSAFPLDLHVARSNIIPRAKSYSVVNVDGGSSTILASTVVETVTAPAQVTTKSVTITEVLHASSSLPTASSESSTTSTWGEPFTLATTPGSSMTSSASSIPTTLSTTSTWGEPFTLATTPGSSSAAASATFSSSTLYTNTSTSIISSSSSTRSLSFTLGITSGHPASFTSLCSTPTTSIEPSIVTIVVTASDSPTTTEYYDNGMWHTLYPVKTFTSGVGNTALSTSVPE